MLGTFAMQCCSRGSAWDRTRGKGGRIEALGHGPKRHTRRAKSVVPTSGEGDGIYLSKKSRFLLRPEFPILHLVSCFLSVSILVLVLRVYTLFEYQPSSSSTTARLSKTTSTAIIIHTAYCLTHLTINHILKILLLPPAVEYTTL